MASRDWSRRLGLSLGLLLYATNLPGLAQPLPQIAASRYEAGSDLAATVALLQQEALDEGGRTAALSSERTYRELVVAQDVEGRGRDPQQVEYEFIGKLIGRYGARGDRLLSVADLKSERERDRSAVTVTPVGDGIAQVRVALLGSGAASQVSQALHQSLHDRGIILDLRGSRGDDPQVAADVARLFLTPSVKPLVQTVGRRNKVRSFDSNLRPLALDIPLVVLVNNATRGGAEALAAQLGRSGRAEVLGSATAGDDQLNGLFALPSGAAIRLVTGRWRTGDGSGFSGGIQLETPAADPLKQAVELLASRPEVPVRPTVFPAQSRIGDKELGFNAGTGDLGIPGSFEYFRGGEGNSLRPRDEIKIWFVPDYIVINYKPPSSLLNFFADRIYTTALQAATDKGVRVGRSTYTDVIAAYGQPGTNGYNEVFPFPQRSRANRSDRYYINYDALGVSFGLETGTNVVREIGIYKPGS